MDSSALFALCAAVLVIGVLTCFFMHLFGIISVFGMFMSLLGVSFFVSLVAVLLPD